MPIVIVCRYYLRNSPDAYSWPVAYQYESANQPYIDRRDSVSIQYYLLERSTAPLNNHSALNQSRSSKREMHRIRAKLGREIYAISYISCLQLVTVNQI